MLFHDQITDHPPIEQSNGPDAVLTLNTRFSFGFMMSQPGAALGPNPKSFGHPGAGGSLGYAARTGGPDQKVAPSPVPTRC
jgi:hypothetical protein